MERAEYRARVVGRERRGRRERRDSVAQVVNRAFQARLERVGCRVPAVGLGFQEAAALQVELELLALQETLVVAAQLDLQVQAGDPELPEDPDFLARAVFRVLPV